MPVPANRPSKISVDFSGVEINKGLGSDHIPAGDYLAEVVDCIQKTKKDDPSTKMLLWSFRIVEPAAFKGKRLLNNTVLKKESLWALRSMLVNMLGEEKIPQSVVSIPIDKIIEAKKKLGVTVEDDEYNGKLKSKIVDTFSLSDWQNRKSTATSDDIVDDDEDDVKASATASDDDEDLDEIDVNDL